MTAKQTQYVVLGVVGAVVLTLGAFFGLIKPQLGNISTYGNEKTFAVDSTTALTATLADLNKKSAEIDAAAGDYQVLANKFPEDFELSAFLNLVAEAARTAGVTITQIDAKPPALGIGSSDPSATAAAATASTIASSNVTVSVKGATNEVRSFVGALAQMQRPVLVDSLTYSDPADGETTALLGGRTFLLSALLTPEEQAALAAQAAVPQAIETVPAG